MKSSVRYQWIRISLLSLGIFITLTLTGSSPPTKAQAICFLLLQALMGDRVDGYYGVAWVGQRKAERMLKACTKKTIGEAYTFIKRQILKRKGGRKEWEQFRLCLDLANILWYSDGEIGYSGVGLNKIYENRHLPFELFLPIIIQPTIRNLGDL